MSNEEIIQQIQAGRSELFLELWEQNQGLIQAIAKRYSAYAPLDDLTQQGYLGLHEAALRYNVSAGTAFATYATYHVRASIHRYIDTAGHPIRLPSGKALAIKHYKQRVQLLTQHLAHAPSASEIEYYLGVPQEKQQELTRAESLCRPDSLERPIDEAAELTLCDTIPDSQDGIASPLEEIHQQELRTAIGECLATLSDEQEAIIKARFMERRTREDISSQIGRASSYVGALEASALRKLRASRCRSKLEPFLEDIRSHGMRSTGLSAFRQSWTSATERAALRLFDAQQA